MTHRPPPLRITVDDQLVDVAPTSLDDTVADLAFALGLGDDTSLLHAGRAPGGRALDPGQRIVDAGIVVGSALRTAASVTGTRPDVHAPDVDAPGVHAADVDAPDVDAPTGDPGDDVDRVAAVEVAVVCGPSCSPWRALAPGRYTIGRSSSAAIRLDDPDAELHHGLLEVAADGVVAVVQLTGRVPMTSDRSVPDEVTCRAGASRIVVRPARFQRSDGLGGSVVPHEHDPWRRVVRRAPPSAPPPPPPAVPVPEPPTDHPAPPALGLIGAATAAAGASIVAVVLGQALFALFACIGASASVLTWAGGVLVARRRRRRDRAAHRQAMDAFCATLAERHLELARRHRRTHRDAVDVLATADAEIWSRRAVDGSVSVTLGRGDVRVTAPIDPGDRARLPPEQLVAVERCEHLVDVAVPLRLSPRSIVAVRGEPRFADGLVRSIVAQLAVDHGPADLRLRVLTERREAWRWANWLPHGGPDRETVLGALGGDVELAAPAGGVSVVVVDAPELLTARTGAVRRALEASGAAAVVLVGPGHSVPAVCRQVLDVAPTGRARWTDGAVLDDSSITIAGISIEEADRVARRLASLTDPEDLEGATASAELDLADLGVAVDARSIAACWRANGDDAPLAATIGDSPDGSVELDLVRDGPHGLIAGTTGSGKSELLRTLVVSLAARVGPDHVTFVLVDFKGGATFDACATLPHTVGVVTDLDDGLAERALLSLDAEIRRRERRLRHAGVDDIAAARRCSPEPLPRLVVIVDEFASLAREHPEILDGLVSIAQRGRSLGIHLLLATQRPAGVVTDDIRANTNLRLALRLQDRSDAIDVVGDPRPARFPAGAPGRALLRLGPDDLIEFRTACCTRHRRPDSGRLTVEAVEPDDRPGPVDDSAPSTIERLVASIVEAAETNGVAPPHRPWVDPLPALLSRDEVGDEFGDDPSVVGIVDEPAEQRRTPLRWDRARGNLWLVGPVGSGTTTALRSLAWAAIASTSPDDCHLYVLDAHGEPGYDDLGGVPHVGDVVRTVESERVDRLLRRLSTELDRRTDTGGRHPTIALLIDGLGAVRSSVAPAEWADAATRLERILRDGPACGIVTAAACDDATAARLASIAAERWDFVAPGRARLSSSGLLAQLVADVPSTTAEWEGAEWKGAEWEGVEGPPPIGVLPEVVRPEALDAAPPEAPGHTALAVGLGATDLAPAWVHVADGDHVLVAGAARTGVTTALRQLEHSWRTRHPDGRVFRADRTDRLDRHHLERAAASSDPVLLAVDDADRIDDPGGLLASIIAERRPGLLVVAAGRLESIRSAYGHWTREVARSRCGLLMTSSTDVDGDLLGIVLPRRSMIGPRPGLAWLVDGRGHRLVQVADRMRP